VAGSTNDLAALTYLLECAAARNLSDYVEALQVAVPELAAASAQCAGGVAAFAGPDSPLTTVKGAGTELSDDDIDQAEDFLRTNGATNVMFELAPWVSTATIQRLANRGFDIAGAEDVVVRAAPFEAAATERSIVIMKPQPWANLMQEAFQFGGATLGAQPSTAASILPRAVNLGLFESDRGIACAQLVPAAGIAIFGNDATLPDARGRGAQTALINERLLRATALGFPHAAAEVAPGSISERNYLRCGFRIAYSRTHYSKRVDIAPHR
jgi:GNAT superfamily N-acetyltransferase